MSLPPMRLLTGQETHRQAKEKGGIRSRPWFFVPAECLWSYAARVAVGAVHRGHIAEVNWMLEGHALCRSHQRLAAFNLRLDGMAGVAILLQDLAIRRDVISVMTTEAS